MKDLSHLPRGKPQARPTFEPNEPTMVNRIVDHWLDLKGDDHLPMSYEDAVFRHSWAGKCTRQVQYLMMGVEETQPTDLTGKWVMDIGSHVHYIMEDLGQFDDWRTEYPVRLKRGDSFVTAGTVDCWHDGIVGELKTIGGFGFKLAATNFKGGPQGPKFAHVRQLALNTLGTVESTDLDVRGGVIMYLSKEAVSQNLAHTSYGDMGRFSAEWFFEKEYLLELGELELHRIHQIHGATRDDLLVQRYLYDDGPNDWVNVVDPEPTTRGKGSWQHVVDDQVLGVGESWECQYCSFQSACKADGPGAIAVDL